MKKKGLLGLIVLLPIAAFLYINFSTKKAYNIKKIVASTDECIRRHFINKGLWDKFELGKKLNDTTFINKDFTYTFTKVLFNGFHLTISNNNDSLGAIVSFEGDTNPLNCVIDFSTIKNPNTGVFADYKYSNLIKKFEPGINAFMSSFENYFNNQKKVYGFEITKERTADANLLVYKEQLKQQPTLQEIYSVVEKISSYIHTKNGEISNPPMLNIFEETPQVYNVMIALPTKQPVQATSNIGYKRLVDGNILVAQVKGGPYTITQAEKEMKNYVEDNKKMSPAIPYQSLVTNRLTETDTAKWITKLYYPVFY